MTNHDFPGASVFASRLRSSILPIASLGAVLGQVLTRHRQPPYDGLGDRQRTLEYLERAYQERSPSMPFLKQPVEFADLAGDPRFQDLLRRMKFP